ncbi:MAG: hypothetical protein EAZ53_01670 [Bacteroidetes bacterium]|nr:MAG: hypothetical protein EAZ53_01670 [Bacteroidota bacterium]
MTFASPLFLYGLFALFVPIIIHLFDLQKPKKVFFSNVNILKSVNQQTVSTRKLKNILILLMRLLFVLFIVLAFAQPFIKTGNEKNTSSVISVFVDNSLSMNSSNGSSTPLNESLLQLEKMASSLQLNTKYYFLDNNFQSKDNFQLSKDRFKDRLTETKPTSTVRNFEDIYKKINLTKGLTSENERNTMLLFSDFQKSTIGNLLKTNFDSTQKIILIPMQNSDVSNVFIDTIWVENLFNTENTKNTLHFVIKNSGKKKINPNIKFFIDEAQNANTSISLEANEKKEILFDFITKDRNAKKCKLKIENDVIAFDNEYFFMLNASPLIRILSIGRENNTYINSVYQSEKIFQYQENKLGSLSAKDLGKSNLCIVNGFDKLNQSEQNQLLEFAEKGGNLVFFPTNNINQTDLENVLKKFKIENNLLITNSLAIENKTNLQFPDTKNPLFESVFEKIDKSTTMPYVFPVFKAENKNTVLLSTANELPFLTKKTISKGNIYLFSVPIETQYSNFFIHSIFVPTMYKIAFLSNNSSQKMAYVAGEKNIKLPFVLPNNDQKIKITSNKFSYIPEQILQADGLVFKMPNLSVDAGYYGIKWNDSTLTTIAINPSKAESVLEFYSKNELSSIFENNKNIEIIDNEANVTIGDYMKNQSQGIALWKYFVILALVSLLAETLLIRYLK